ncbi:MAG: polyprenyl synthetase family protein [Thermodesulfovibrionales bacterium]|jgi:octaprenyl-diphosphate synthase|nr:polyprenyl synthetase family protein [Thermodesulfovibrionales bacterium]
MDVKDIFADYSEELKIVDQELLGIFKSNVFLIPMVGQHILGSGGKRIRPIFLLLSADLCGYKGQNRTLLAAIIEAIHTASLLHDDVIDGAETRRGRPTAHSIWGNQIVILTGDFLYSNALKLAVAQKNQKIMEALSEATTRMTEGEILQLHKTGDPDITRDEYFEIISAKTGVLISAACRIAGILANQPEEKEMALSRFGMKTGIAFQLADDVLDYVAEQKDLGKRLGKDLEEGKITMPLIYLLKTASEQERIEIRELIKGQGAKGKGQGSNNGLNRILELFSKYNAIEESLKVARSLVDEAKSELDIFPASRQKDALLIMAEYAMQREK